MQLTGFDLLGFVFAGVAVVFSGFVLAHSTVGGLALAGAGALAASVPMLRDRTGSRAVGALAWLAVVGLLAAGVGGFLVGFGIFDEPDVRWESNATLYDGPGNGSTVLVTGTVTNAGDGAAEGATVTATLVDSRGDDLRSESKSLSRLGPNATQQFFFRFESDGDDLERFADATVTVDVSG